MPDIDFEDLVLPATYATTVGEHHAVHIGLRSRAEIPELSGQLSGYDTAVNFGLTERLRLLAAAYHLSRLESVLYGGEIEQPQRYSRMEAGLLARELGLLRSVTNDAAALDAIDRISRVANECKSSPDSREQLFVRVP